MPIIRTMLAVAAVALAAAAATVPSAPARRAAEPLPTREAADSFRFNATWQQLESGVLRYRADATSFAGPSAFFRPIRAVFDVRDADTALDWGGEEGPCEGSSGPITCSRIRVKAIFTLADFRWLDRLKTESVTWCVTVYGKTGATGTLEDHLECQDSYVSVYWERAAGVSYGWIPMVEVEGFTYAREDFVWKDTTSIAIRLAAVPDQVACERPYQPPVVPGLAPGMGVYEAARVLSPKDDRWDLLLRRVERQRAGLRRHLAELEDAAYEAAYIYVFMPVDVALMLLGGPVWREAGYVLRNGRKLLEALAANEAKLPGAQGAERARIAGLIKLILQRLERLARP